MKKGYWFSLAVFFCVSMILWLPAAAPAAEKPIELRVSSWMPAKSVDTEIAEYWIKQVEQKTGGRVKFSLYTASALGQMKDHYDMAVKGIADISFHTISNNPGRHPLSEILHLPFLIPSSEVGGKVFIQLYKEFPELRAEFSGVQVLGLGTIDTWNFHTIRKPIRTMEDMKGVKFRVPGGIASEAVKALGGVPMGIPVPELYLSLQKGVIDGTVIGWEGVVSWKLFEQLRQYTDVGGFTTLTQGLFMNKESFNKLPPDVQKVMAEEMGMTWWSEQKGRISHDAWAEKGRAMAKQNGGTIYSLPADEKAKWVKTIMPLREGYVKSLEAKGLPGSKILARALELVKQ